MLRLQHDLFFWTLVHDYVRKGYRVITKTDREVWLYDETKQPQSLVRFVRSDIDWANELRRDVEEAVKRFPFLQKQLHLKQVVAENVYVSVYPPVDDWDDVKRPIKFNDRLTIYTSIIHREYGMITNEPQREFDLPDVRYPFDSVEALERAIEEKQAEIESVVRKRSEEEQALFSSGKAVATYALLFSIAVMYITLELSGGSTSLLTLIEFGAKFNPLILEGQWWRFISAMFLHIGFLHFFMNSLALFYLGTAVERMYGTVRFLIIYFVAGFFGSLASFLFNEQISAGASAAIFGCFGALLYFGTVHKHLFFRTIGKNVIFLLIINIGFGLAVPMIDNGAHIGGLIGGFIAANIVQLPKEKLSLKQIIAFLTAGIAALSLFSYGMNTKDAEIPGLVAMQLAREYILQEDFERAYPLLEHAIETEPDRPEVTFMLGYIEGKNGNYEKAKQYFLRTIELRPDLHEAHYNLAIIYFELGEEEKGRKALDRALYYAPDDERYLQLKEEVNP